MHENLDGQMTQIDKGSFGKQQAQPLAVCTGEPTLTERALRLPLGQKLKTRN